MKNRLWFVLCLFFLSTPQYLQAGGWTPTTSEENGLDSPAYCQNSLTSGLYCSGRYCDSVSLQCSDSLKVESRDWSPWFSEEQEAYVCPQGQYVQGLRCSGRYCDSVSVQCAKANVRETSCEWRPAISEENGGTHEFGKGNYLKGLKCHGKYCDSLESLVCRTEAKVCDTDECKEEQAKRFAPILKFDQSQEMANKCFPSDAGDYWNARKNGEKGIICNESSSSIHGGQVPIYYQYQDCSGDSTVIMYWFFYGFQDTCMVGQGSHHADWERVAVKIKDGRLERVLYYQHGGSYTRQGNNLEVVDGTHPVAYIGKNSHGSYHDDGGTGTCLYFEDHRNPANRGFTMKTEDSLVPLRRGHGAPEWMTSNQTANFDGIPGPLNRGINLCSLPGCSGNDTFIPPGICLGQCGCSKSDIGGSPF